MALLRSLLRRKASLIVELALLTPVPVLAILGGLEVRRMRAVEAKLSDAASEMLAERLGLDHVSESRRKLSRLIGVNENEIVVAGGTGDSVTVSVPYAKAGSTLAFLCSGARLSATASHVP